MLEQISKYVKENRIAFKRSQEYVSTIDKNSDGSYTVCLKIRSALIDERMFEIKIKGVDVGEVIKSLKTKDGRKEFYRKHKLIILYVTFGIGTTIISFGSYYLFRFIFPNAESVPSWLSWIFKLTAPFNI